MYGLNREKRSIALSKIDKQKSFLSSHYINFPNGDQIPLIDLFKNSYINSSRYISEVNHRVWSLYHYANSNNLTNVFVTITLPSRFHPYKNIGKKRVKNRDFNNSTPREASKQLSLYLSRITSNTIYSEIPRDSRCYFRSIEPHKSGVPHTHASFFIPSDKVSPFIEMLRRYASRWQCQIHVESNIKNPVSYVMKYILKTFDDFRDGGKGLSDLSLWYIYHGISRFYTSRTLVSLDVYRKLNGRFSLIELTKSYRDKTLSVMCDKEGKIVFIQNDLETIYYRKRISIKSFDEPINPPKLKIDLYSKIRERERKKYSTIPIEIDGEEFFMVDGKLYKYQKSISLMSDDELIIHRWNLLNSNSKSDLIYRAERALINRGIRNMYSIQAQMSDEFAINYKFEADLEK